LSKHLAFIQINNPKKALRPVSTNAVSLGTGIVLRTYVSNWERTEFPRFKQYPSSPLTQSPLTSSASCEVLQEQGMEEITHYQNKQLFSTKMPPKGFLYLKEPDELHKELPNPRWATNPLAQQLYRQQPERLIMKMRKTVVREINYSFLFQCEKIKERLSGQEGHLSVAEMN
jgi:hypothetical protein